MVEFGEISDNTNNQALVVQEKVIKKSKGKQKIEKMERIEKKSSRQVTFSKRREGLFKKCAELCTKYGAQVGVITFSEAGKLYSFGHPSADAVVERFVYGDPNLTNNTLQNSSSCYEYDLAQQQQYNAGKSEASSRSCRHWLDQSMEYMGLEELEQFKVALEEFRNEVVKRANNNAVSCSSSMLVPQGYYYGAMTDARFVGEAGFDSSVCYQHGTGKSGVYLPV